MRAVHFVAIVLVLLVAAACGKDATGPDAGTSVVVSIDSLNGPGFAFLDNRNVVVCDVYLAATATGTGRAAWADGYARFYWGSDRSVPLDSLPFSVNEIAGSWDEPTIGASGKQRAFWQFWFDIPFEVELVMNYAPKPGAQQQQSKVRFACGPKLTPATPYPTISDVSIEPAAGEVEPGQTLRLKYSASAEGRLMSTRWLLSGPCDAQQSFDERLVPTATHDVTFVLPRACALGVPMTITVAAVDGGTRVKGVELKPALTIVDKTPPTLLPLYFNPIGVPIGQTKLRGGFFAGQTLTIYPGAGDNHAVRSVHWEVLPFGAQDSVIATPGFGVPSLGIPTQPDWTGKIQIRLWAEDEVGLRSAVVSTEPDSVVLWPTTVRPTRTGNVAGAVYALAVDPSRQLLYVATISPSMLYTLSLSTLAIVSSVPLAAPAVDMDLTTSGDSLLMAVNGSAALSVADVRQAPYTLSSLAISGLDVGRGVTPQGVRILSNGHALVAVGGFEGETGLRDVDLATGTSRDRPDAARGRFPANKVSRSGDRRVAVLNDGCLQRYDVVTDRFSSCSTSQVFNVPPVADATASRVAVSLNIYDGALAFERHISSIFGSSVPNVALSPDGASLYEMAGSTGVIRSRTSDGVTLERYPNPIPAHFMVISPDGKLLVTVESNVPDPSRLSVISLP